MKKFRFSLIGLALILTGITEGESGARDDRGPQPVSHQVTDFVELSDNQGEFYIEFHENWKVSVDGRNIMKVVNDFTIKDLSASSHSADELQTRYRQWAEELPITGDLHRLKDHAYEFYLLDPHLKESGNMAFPEPDSMDGWTRRLQADLISLIQKSSLSLNRYDLDQQLLSVIFHERWDIDPQLFSITKRITGITPVIWQRRETTDGEPVNDAETGLPVYYKNSLSRIDLRNPK